MDLDGSPGRAAPDPVRVRERALGLWPEVVRSLRQTELLADPVPVTLPDGRVRFESADQLGRAVSVRLDAVPLPAGRLLRVHANTTSEQHVIQLSDRLTDAQTGPVLAMAAAELMTVRRRADLALPPVRNRILRPNGTETTAGTAAELSGDDLNALGELDWLARDMADPSATEATRRAARDAFSGRLDDLGLRIRTGERAGPRYEAENQARLFRTLAVEPHLRFDAYRALRELGRPIEELAPADQAALQTYRRTAATRQRPEPAPPVPTPAGPMSREELVEAARQASLAREARSRETIIALKEAAAPGTLPKVRIMLGGGASWTARGEGVLNVDNQGRWHADPLRDLVQTADQTRHLIESGLGDPYQFGLPRERVPLEALRLWEDTAAVKGPLVNGYADLTVDDAGRLVAEIHPADGSESIRVEVDGVPVIATGIPPETVPGVGRTMPTTARALAAIDRNLATVGTPEAQQVRAELDRLNPDAAGAAASALRTLRAAGLESSATGDPLQTLAAVEVWDQAKLDAPGRVLQGDDVSNSRSDPRAANAWLIGGLGGAGFASAEIILDGNPDATVTMVGVNTPEMLQNTALYGDLRRKHDKSFDPDASGRLVMVTNNRLGPLATEMGPDGRTTFRVVDDRGNDVLRDDGSPVRGDGYVACIGRPSRTPRVLDHLEEWSDRVSGKLLFDEQEQYVGYQLTFGRGDQEHTVDVTGGSSRMLPDHVFSAADLRKVGEIGMSIAPVESGNVDLGFTGSAIQGKQYADYRRERDTADALRLAGIGESAGARSRTAVAVPSEPAARSAGRDRNRDSGRRI